MTDLVRRSIAPARSTTDRVLRTVDLVHTPAGRGPEDPAVVLAALAAPADRARRTTAHARSPRGTATRAPSERSPDRSPMAPAALRPPRDCPCHSGARYVACCGPLHRAAAGEDPREAETPALLMRSRYAAFALGLGPYLVRTLAKDHEDLALPRAELIRALSDARHRQRFMGLRILHEAYAADEGEVMFHARIFEKGVDVSFVELSRFVREGAAWRYSSGILVPKADLPEDLDSLTPADLRRRA